MNTYLKWKDRSTALHNSGYQLAVHGCLAGLDCITFPELISSNGKSALYIDVVFHHMGRPRKTITSQNASIMYDRVRISCGFSGGGRPLFATGFGVDVAIADTVLVVSLKKIVEEGVVPSSALFFVIASCPAVFWYHHDWCLRAGLLGSW